MKHAWILVTALAMTAACSTAAAAQDGPTRNHTARAEHNYAVIFEITLDGQGKARDVTVSKVIDAATGSTDAVDIPVSDVFVAEQKAIFMQKSYESGREKVYSYQFYDPRRSEGTLN